ERGLRRGVLHGDVEGVADLVAGGPRTGGAVLVADRDGETIAPRDHLLDQEVVGERLVRVVGAVVRADELEGPGRTDGDLLEVVGLRRAGDPRATAVAVDAGLDHLATQVAALDGDAGGSGAGVL